MVTGLASGSGASRTVFVSQRWWGAGGYGAPCCMVEHGVSQQRKRRNALRCGAMGHCLLWHGSSQREEAEVGEGVDEDPNAEPGEQLVRPAELQSTRAPGLVHSSAVHARQALDCNRRRIRGRLCI